MDGLGWMVLDGLDGHDLWLHCFLLGLMCCTSLATFLYV